MEKEIKKSISFRLTPTAIKLVKAIAAEKGVSQAAALEMAIREMAKRESIAAG